MFPHELGNNLTDFSLYIMLQHDHKIMPKIREADVAIERKKVTWLKEPNVSFHCCTRAGKWSSHPLTFITVSRFFVSLWKTHSHFMIEQSLRCNLDGDLLLNTLQLHPDQHGKKSQRAANDRQRVWRRSLNMNKKKRAANVENDFKAVRMNLAFLITPSYFLSAYSSRSVVASHGPFGSFWNVAIISCTARLETYIKSRI